MNDLSSQKGGVIFYILLAVGLLAALTYAASRGSRTGENQLSLGQARSTAAAIINYGENLSNTIGKLKLRGCTDREISFENSVTPSTYVNPNSPTDESCHVFSLNGGRATIQHPPIHGTEWFFSQHAGWANWDNPNDPGWKEAVLILRNVDQTVCEIINDNLDLANQMTEAIDIPFINVVNGYLWNGAVGDYNSGGVFFTLRNASNNGVIESTSVSEGCGYNYNSNGGAGEYNYLKVLIVT